jgi:hypothetical protein
MFTAWHIARMTTYGDKSLKGLGDWLKTIQPPKPVKRQTGAEIIAALRAIKETLH